MPDEPLIEAWRITSRVVIDVLAASTSEALALNGATRSRGLGALDAAREASGDATAALAAGKISGFRPHPQAFAA